MTTDNQRVTNTGYIFPNTGHLFFLLHILLAYKKTKGMSTNKNEQLLSHPTVKIYKPEQTYLIFITFDNWDDAGDTANVKNQKPVYSRTFSDMLDALGHYMVLKILSEKSIEQLIRKYETPMTVRQKDS